MLLPIGRDRRIVGRPQDTRLHCDAAAGSCGGAQRNALLAGAPRRHGEPQRSSDALADRISAVAGRCVRSASIGSAGMERRAVPRTGSSAGAVEPHS